MNKFKKGDKVVCVNAGGNRLIQNGNTYLVQDSRKSASEGWVCIEGEDYYAHRFELVKEDKEMFDINDLTTGMRIKTKNGFTGIVLKDIDVISFKEKYYTNISKYTNDLKTEGFSLWDIVEIYSGYKNSSQVLNFEMLGDLLWKYEEESPQQKRIKELEQTITQASQQIAALKEEMK